ncbi:MAG: DUF3791 domain-containing protein [Lachnospiraceae bacterium]|nr:DUF3791 domain-containing protein [Lachnospiraceae bacterium]
MSKEATFLIYCMERYRYNKSLSGAEVSETFDKYNVYDYILSFFESLHTMGEPLIIQDIDNYIASENAS